MLSYQILPKSDEKHRNSNFGNFWPPNFFEKSAQAKLSKLERFAWSHWIQKYLIYSSYQFHPKSRPRPKMAQLLRTFLKKKWKTSFLSKDQKVELVMRLFFRQTLIKSYSKNQTTVPKEVFKFFMYTTLKELSSKVPGCPGSKARQICHRDLNLF